MSNLLTQLLSLQSSGNNDLPRGNPSFDANDIIWKDTGIREPVPGSGESLFPNGISFSFGGGGGSTGQAAEMASSSPLNKIALQDMSISPKEQNFDSTSLTSSPVSLLEALKKNVTASPTSLENTLAPLKIASEGIDTPQLGNGEPPPVSVIKGQVYLFGVPIEELRNNKVGVI